MTGLLADGRFAAALAAYLLLALGLALAGTAAHSRLQEPVARWSWDHFFLPLARAGLLAGFVLASYPALYHLPDAPAASALLAQGRLGGLLALLYLLSLGLPLLPGPTALPGLALPVQGAAAVALVFHWLAPAQAGYWPGGITLLGMVACSGAAWWLARRIAAALGDWARETRGIADLASPAFEFLILALQLPVPILYAGALGRQLSA